MIHSSHPYLQLQVFIALVSLQVAS